MDYERGNGDLAQPARSVPGGQDRPQLAAGGVAVVIAVVAPAREVSDLVLVLVEPRRADGLEDRGGVLDVGVALARRPLQKEAVHGERGLAFEAAAGGGHD